MTELRNRGVQDILIAVVDRLKGSPEAITSVFPQTVVRTCIVHLIRYSMQFCSWKERQLVAALRPIRLHGLRRHTSGWRISIKTRGARNIQPSRRAGGATGSR